MIFGRPGVTNPAVWSHPGRAKGSSLDSREFLSNIDVIADWSQAGRQCLGCENWFGALQQNCSGNSQTQTIYFLSRPRQSDVLNFGGTDE
jgi:hypothetical protein